LKEINFAMNGFGDEGALAVAEVLMRSTTLYVLDVSYNRISTPGASAIGKALEQNDALRTLRVIQLLFLLIIMLSNAFIKKKNHFL
jgi:Ran GTPase-activating protein (RanGAP) involved in mRNA processing and transport